MLGLAQYVVQQLPVRPSEILKLGLAARKQIKLGRARLEAVPPSRSSVAPCCIDETLCQWASV